LLETNENPILFSDFEIIDTKGLGVDKFSYFPRVIFAAYFALFVDLTTNEIVEL
jgi:hypothetical protein